MKYQRYLEKIYYDPAHPASYSGLDKLYRSVKKDGKFVLDRAKIRKWLMKQETYTLHKGVIRKFKRQKIVVPYIDYMWEADTGYMNTYVNDNDGISYFLLIIDGFSKFVWTFPVRRVRGEEVLKAFKTIQNRRCEKLRTDSGSEFKSKLFQKWLKSQGIQHFYSLNESKCAFAERALKSIKSRIARYMTRYQTHRWIDILSKVTDSYNNTYHRSIKRSPASVTKSNEAELWNTSYNQLRKGKRDVRVVSSSAYRFKTGDTVRLSHLKRPFQREYDERWTMEYFIVAERGKKAGIPFYKLKDLQGDEIKGSFYSNELTKIIVDKTTTFRLEKVLKRSGNRVLVKWMGWSDKYNSWIHKSKVTSYKKRKNGRVSQHIQT
ncbi:uncharacterized protein LOC123560684 [Mercenaria mercenaria]|uniref:uncharacterized protein LOC123560684 n=1 Tax=Mercenaria mercenaria TaxID=6596 RepID=UPI00234F334A|nr:uncharacterized protein LOC123560684 [Mercenaria mercenaria]